MKRLVLPFALALAALAACVQTPPRNTDDDDGASDGGTSSAATSTTSTGAGGSPPTSAKEICAQYLTCLSQTSPTELAIAMDAYGDEGSCWSGGDPELCGEACLTGMQQHHGADPDACPACFEDAHCSEEGDACYDGDCAACAPTASCSECVAASCNEQCAYELEECAQYPECEAVWECVSTHCILGAADSPACQACPPLTGGDAVNAYFSLSMCMCETCTSDPDTCFSGPWTCE